MLIITAPAKTLDLTSDYPHVEIAQPVFLDKAAQIAATLKRQSIYSLRKLMDVSDKIAEENYVRYQRWHKDHSIDTSRPAIFTYNGDIFVEMHPRDWDTKQQVYAQRSVRIISGLYGMLRPYDLMQPYRLEMKTKLSVGRARSLYDFWKESMTEELNREIAEQKHAYFLNLASDEYAHAIELNRLNASIIHVEFLEKEGDGYRSVPIYNKHARGMMIEYAVTHLAETPDDLKGFVTSGYKFLKFEDENTLIFTRN